MGKITLITGGARSGKSAHAIELARQGDASKHRFFLATAEGLDDEMRQRIARHRFDRPAEFQTVEEPIAVVDALERLEQSADIVVVDCLTLWVSNLLGRGLDDSGIIGQAERLAKALAAAGFASLIVTDEVGLGIVPENPLARRFRDLLGWTNQKIAQAAASVILMVSGYPVRVK